MKLLCLGRLRVLAVIAAGLAAPLQGQVTSWVVAYSGMQAPGVSPVVFDNFCCPAIAPQGEIIFQGRLATTPNGYGLWRETFDPVTQVPVLSLVQREGAPSPLPGFSFAGFPGPPTINLPGRFAFKANVSNGAIVNDTLWVEKPLPAGLTLVAREGTPAPGVPGANFGALFSGVYEPLLLDNSGRAVFVGRLTGGGVTAANDTGLWFYDGAAVALVAREGDQMPGLPAGHFFGDTFLSLSARLGNGYFIFYATDGHPVSPIRGLWINTSGGSSQPLILEGGSAPGLASDETLTLIASYRMNNNNQVAFDGIIRKDNGINPPTFLRGVWISNTQGAFQLAARSDQAPPDGRVPPVTVFTDGGHVFGRDDAGKLVRVTTAGLTTIAKFGDPAPGTAAGVQFASIDIASANNAAIAASSAGQVAFRAVLQGPGVNTTNDRGLWALDDSFQLVKVAREGDTIEAPAGMPRTITGIEFAIGAGSGQPRGMSNRGEVLWRANVAGLPFGAHAVVVTSVGTPPVPPQLVGLEVVQAVQNWRNEIPLIDGKKTVVRAHLESQDPLRFVGQLRGFVGGPGGAELPGSPLAPANPGGYVNLDAASANRRHLLGGGLYFELPEWWTTGSVNLRVEPASPGVLDCREVAGPVVEDCQTTVSFLPGEVPRVRFLGVSWNDGTSFRHASVDRAADVAWRAHLAFPTASIQWDFLGSALQLPQLPVVDDMLPLIDLLHTADGSPRRIYYGIVASERPAGGSQGVAYLDGWAGVSHVPADPKGPARNTVTHELGHSLGRDHSIHSSQLLDPDGNTKGACGEIGEPTATDFPNWFQVNGLPRPTLGPMDQGPTKLVFGLDMDLMEVADPTRVFDLMSYCRDPRLDRWPSNHTYGELRFSINSRFASPAVVGGSTGDHFVARGNVYVPNGPVQLFPFATLVQTAAPEPPPAGDYLLRLRSGADALLGEIAFAPRRINPEGPDPGFGSFLIGVPTNPLIRKVEIVHGGLVVASRTASANAPAVQVTSPNGGENFNGPTVFLQWTGSDADGDPLTYMVQYSPDNGTTWTTLGVDLTSTDVNIPRSSLPGSAQGLLRVHASDGFLTAFDTSNGPFTVANNPPFVSIDDPDTGRLYVSDQLVFFDALSFDPEDGNLADSRFSWTSNLNGPLGTDNNFSRVASGLSAGTHLITVTATDSSGAQATDTTTIRIAAQAAGPLTDLTVAFFNEVNPVVAGSPTTYTVHADNDGPDAASGVSLTFSVTLDPTGPTGPGPATILSIVAPGWNCVTGSGTATCTRAAMASLDETVITFEVAASQVGALTATTQISGAQDDPATGNNAAQQITVVELPPPASVNMSVTKTHVPASPLVGHDLTYTITARNNGPDPATGVTVGDTLPAQVSFVSVTASQGGCTGTSTINCSLGSLSSGAQATVTIVVRPTSTGMISNTATVSSDQPDPTPGNNQSTDVIGAVGTNGPFAFHTVTPCRLLDTRLPDGPLGGPALAGTERSFPVAGNCGIPATAKAVSANITVTGPASQGHLSLYPAGFGLPLVSSINFRGGQTRANNVTLPLGTGGAITVQAALIGGTVHFILDVNGYYE